jgi:hypothetical protein
MGDENSSGSLKLTPIVNVVGLYSFEDIKNLPALTGTYYANKDSTVNVEGILEAEYGNKAYSVKGLLHLTAGDPSRATQPKGGELKVDGVPRRFDWPQALVTLRAGSWNLGLGRWGHWLGPGGVSVKDLESAFLNPWETLTTWTVTGGYLAYENAVTPTLEVSCKAGLTLGQDRLTPKQGNSLPYIVASCGFSKPNSKDPTLALTLGYEGGPDHENEPNLWRHIGDFKLVGVPVPIISLKAYAQGGVEGYTTGPRKFYGGSLSAQIRATGSLSFFSLLARAAYVYDEKVRTTYNLSALDFTVGPEFKVHENVKFAVHYNLFANINNQKFEGHGTINRIAAQFIFTKELEWKTNGEKKPPSQ